MRLVRRTLLCLVVGVTAFGAAGWGLRPKPLWTSRLPEGDLYSFVAHVGECADADPVWIESIGQEACAYRAADGALLQSIPAIETGNTNATFLALADGRLVVDASNQDEHPTRSRFHLFTIASALPMGTVELLGDWQLADDGLHAWRKRWQPPGFVIESADLSKKGSIRKTEFKERLEDYQEELVDYSAAASLIAVSDAMKEGAKPPFGIELYDAITGQLVRRIPLGSQEPDDGPQSIRFGDAGAFLNVRSLGGELLTFDTQRGVLRRNAGPAPPPGTTDPTDLMEQAGGGGRSVWILIQFDAPSAWICFLKSPADPPHWRRCPIGASVEGSPEPIGGRLSRRLNGARVRLVPQMDQVLVEHKEEPLVASVPRAFQQFLPTEWTLDPNVTRLYWHDWGRAVWRDMALPGEVGGIEVRPHAVLTISGNSSGMLLQSWPLPPPNPKPCALAIAALCMAGTWWLCAWRYRRRMRLASVGAA